MLLSTYLAMTDTNPYSSALTALSANAHITTGAIAEASRLERIALLRIKEARLAMLEELASLQDTTSARRVSAIALAQVLGMVKYGKDNERELLPAIAAVGLPFHKWMRVRRSTEEAFDASRADFLAWRKAEKRLVDMRNRVLLDALPLIPLVRRKLGDFPSQLADDLDSEGVLGIVQSLERYDPSRGIPFKSYASIWIKERMLAYLSRLKTVRVPQQAATELRNYRRKLDELESELGHHPDDEEIATHLHLDASAMREKGVVVVSLDAPVSDSSPDAALLGESIADPNAVGVDGIVDGIDRRAYLARLTSLLDSRKREDSVVMRARLGGGGHDGLSGAVLRTPQEAWAIARTRALHRVLSALGDSGEQVLRRIQERNKPT